MRRSISAVVLLGLLAACGNSDDDPAAKATSGAASPATSTATATAVARGDCSAGELRHRKPEKQGIPDPVAKVRTKVIQDATACDYDELEKLALDGAESFSYSFGEPSRGEDLEPGAYWKDQEEADQALTATLVRILRLAPGKTSVEGEEMYVWPAAAADEDPSAEDRESVEKAFKDENVDEWFTDNGYIGPRAGITAEGDWLFFVSGGD